MPSTRREVGVANFVFNISKGRAAEFYNRVDINDPAAAELVIMLLAATGIETDAVLRDMATLAAFAPDDGADVVNLDIPDQTWVGVANDGTGAIGDLDIGYDPVGAQTMADIVPMTQHDFAVTPDGSDITAQIAAAGFYQAS